jgi:hypothetical protein
MDGPGRGILLRPAGTWRIVRRRRSRWNHDTSPFGAPGAWLQVAPETTFPASVRMTPSRYLRLVTSVNRVASVFFCVSGRTTHVA